MRKFIISLATIAAGIAGVSLVTVNTPASASTGCVTRAEWRQVDIKGRDAWTRDHVTRVFGVRGRGTGAVLYPTCRGGMRYPSEVDFYHGRATWKWYPDYIYP